MIEWRDVKDRYIRSVELGESWPSQPAMDETLRKFHKQFAYNEKSENSDKWYGGTPHETIEWLKYGYYSREILHSAEYVPLALKDHVSWSDEDGEADISRLIGGYDDFYLGISKQIRKPGVRVLIEMSFVWSTSTETIRQYGAWIAGLLQSLEATGYDLTIDIWIPVDEVFEDDAPGIRTHTLIRVKQENEISNFTEWSALFSPAGYRHLVFTAQCVAGDKIGKRVNYLLGHTIGGRTWSCQYDNESSTLKITVDQRPTDMFGGDPFPKELLNKQALESGLIAQPLG